MSALSLALTCLSAASVLMIFAGFLALGEERLVTRRLARLDSGETVAAPGLRRWLGAIEPMLIIPGSDREQVEQSLAAAGFRDPSAPAVFGLVRLATPIMVGGALLALALHDNAPSRWDWLLCLCGTALAVLAPQRGLRMLGAARQRRIHRELPFTLDIFVMMLESGVSIDHCFRAFAQGEGQAAPLVQEAVAALVRDLDHGVSYDTALARWGERLAVPGARELASVIQNAMTHGTPTGKALREFSAEFSEKRVANARESVGRKSAKMTVAMLLFIMPALMIVLAGPAVSTLGATIRAMSRNP